MVSKGVFPGSLVKDKQALDLPLIYCLCYSKKMAWHCLNWAMRGLGSLKLTKYGLVICQSTVLFYSKVNIAKCMPLTVTLYIAHETQT